MEKVEILGLLERVSPCCASGTAATVGDRADCSPLRRRHHPERQRHKQSSATSFVKSIARKSRALSEAASPRVRPEFQQQSPRKVRKQSDPLKPETTAIRQKSRIITENLYIPRIRRNKMHRRGGRRGDKNTASFLSDSKLIHADYLYYRFHAFKIVPF